LRSWFLFLIRCLVLVYNISFAIAQETSPCADLSDPCIDHYQYSVFKVHCLIRHCS